MTGAVIGLAAFAALCWLVRRFTQLSDEDQRLLFPFYLGVESST